MSTFTRMTKFAGMTSSRMTRVCVAPDAFGGGNYAEETRFGLPIRVRVTSGLYIGEARAVKI